MAMVLPILRLWLLLLNIYGTFKSMKPPPQSQRSARNRQGHSARAMQLRKRGLKSSLAVWVVWAVFSTIESPLDHTFGLVTPFYHELKCIIFLFLLVARSHGAEAIFLHIIHPLLRPYVPAVDDILANLHSVFDLLTLLFILPWEYVSYWRHHWSWRRKPKPAGDDSSPPTDHGAGDGGQALDQGRRLRPRNDVQQARLREAERQAHVVFQDIDDAQHRMRTRTRSQPAAPASRNSVRSQPIRGSRGAAGDPKPKVVGLRTRRRVQTNLPLESGLAPGSTMTGIHHVDLLHTDGLPQVPISRPFPAFPHAPTTQPVLPPSQPANPMPTQTRPASRYEIWHPPQSALEARARGSPSSDESSPQMASPIYPPIPSAYPFTPRRSELPPSPGIASPSSLVAPTPRRASTGAAIGDGINDIDDVDLPAGHATAGSMKAHSAEPWLPGEKQKRMQAEDFFGQAPELSIQAAEMDMDMDMDTETLSTRDSSGASEEAMEVGGDDVGADQIGGVASRTRGGPRTRGEPGSGLKEGRGTATELLRRSTRKRRDRSTSVETDEFGFTIRPKSAATRSRGVASSLAGPSKKKPLARTKPAQDDDDETQSSDEEIVKKRRKLRLGAVVEERDSRLQEDEDEDRRKEEADSEVTSQRQDNGTMRSRDKRKAAVRQADVAQVVSTVKPGHIRATRASTRQRIGSREVDPQGAGITKRGKGG